MAYQIDEETMSALNEKSAALLEIAWAKAPVEITAGATDDEIVQARSIQAVVLAVNSVLQSMPLTQVGVLVAMGAVSGTVLGQCDGDRKVLWAMFQQQMAATLAEIGAARMPAQGNA